MRTRWSDVEANRAVLEWSAQTAAAARATAIGQGEHEALAHRIYTARLIGREPDLVLHGGGNVSVKATARTLLGHEVEVIHVKASGRDMAALQPHDLPAMELTQLRRLRALERLDDDEMVNQIRRAMLDTSGPLPSIETLVHAFLPHRFVDHSHADAVLCLTNQPNPQELIREAVGDRAAILPYVKPGFDLAKAVADTIERQPGIEGIVLIQHGLITFADDARTSYERHIAIVTACGRLIEARLTEPRSFPSRDSVLPSRDHTSPSRDREAAVFKREGGTRESGVSAAQLSGPLPPCQGGIEGGPAAHLVARVSPILRGLLAHSTGDDDRPYVRSILEWRCGDELLTIINSDGAARLAATGPLTGDHLIRTKPWPMYVESPAWSDEAALREQLRGAVSEYRTRYERYLRNHGGSTEGIDLSPRVLLLPHAGLFTFGPRKKDAIVAADIAEHTLFTKAKAARIGSFVSLPEDRLFEMEYRWLQLSKLSGSGAGPLAGQVVAISGGAGAIGVGIAEACAVAGAHVAIVDLDRARMETVVERIAMAAGKGVAIAVEMDVTDEASVAAGFAEIVRAFGGVDVVVPNAGVAAVSPIEALSAAEFRRVMEVNATGAFLFMREGVRVLKTQGLGGHVIVISSKNVLAPGKDFAAYSASKAAAHQLGKVAAVELAADGIRVNLITPDAVFGDEELPSGLWAAVGPDRAKSRDLDPAELPEFYRNRSLLKLRVHPRHVGNAVVFFASNQTPTTGAVLPVDSGLPEAFPR